ncbi:MAG TPA: hypothetical protein VLK27_04915 [Chthoniobacterales bacterium]|nr:hypothetical protein [Chthoniobacterales bacterium]
MKTSTSGHSGIFAFAFRIHAEEKLREHDTAVGEYRYRVYEPFLVRKSGSFLTDEIPMRLWPKFEWNNCIPTKLRGEQGASPELRYTGRSGPCRWYDGLRVDIYGPNAVERVEPFVSSFMRWLRHVSGQPWIGAVDHHHLSEMQRLFAIDSKGAAVEQAGGCARMVVMPRFKLLTDETWRTAFVYATLYEPPIHSSLFFDALNAAAINDYSRAVMNLAMSLESCRDETFSRLHPTAVSSDEDQQSAAPFEGTDLLKHLSKNAKQAFGRSFEEEEPEHWVHLRKLYVTRHHVAHGRPAMFRESGKWVRVDMKNFEPMELAARSVLHWIDQLVKNSAKPPQELFGPPQFHRAN